MEKMITDIHKKIFKYMDKRPECLDKNGNMKREIIELIDSTIEEYKRQILNNCLDYLNSPKNRTLIILSSLPISLVIFYLVRCLYNTKIDDHLVTSIILSPVLILLWKFRDQNTRHQIENSRKDTNLKDFHQLSIWATDYNLKDKNNPLKISSIALIGKYLSGQYGDEFKRPAFEVLMSTWSHHQPNITLDKSKKLKFNNLESIDEIQLQTQKAILEKILIYKNLKKTILHAIFVDGSKTIRENDFKNSFKGTTWIGITTDDLVGFKSLDLSNLNLSQTKWYGSEVNNFDFSNSNLTNSDFSGGFISNSIFNGSDMSGSLFERCVLYNTKFEHAAKLVQTRFIFTALRDVSFISSNLNEIVFYSSIFYKVNLNASSAEEITINYSNIKDIEADENTNIKKIKLRDTNYELLPEELKIWIKNKINTH